MSIPVFLGGNSTQSGVATYPTTNILTTPTTPRTPVAGDCLVAWVMGDQAEQGTPSLFQAVAGWTLVDQVKDAGNLILMGLYTRVATGTEGATYTFTQSAGCDMVGIIQNYGNFYQFGNSVKIAASGGAGSKVTLPSTSVTTPNCLLAFAVSTEGGSGTISTPASSDSAVVTARTVVASNTATAMTAYDLKVASASVTPTVQNDTQFGPIGIAAMGIVLIPNNTTGIGGGNLAQGYPRVGMQQVKNYTFNTNTLTSMNTDATIETGIGKFGAIWIDCDWPRAIGPADGVRTRGDYWRHVQPGQVMLLYAHGPEWASSTSATNGDSLDEWERVGNPSGAVPFIVGSTAYLQPPTHHLCFSGSTLNGALTNVATSCPVVDGTQFMVGDFVVIGGGTVHTANSEVGELARVTAIAVNTLTLTRGHNKQLKSDGTTKAFPGVAHNSGDWIRPVVHLFGTFANNLTYNNLAFNMSSSCPALDLSGLGGLAGTMTYAQVLGNWAGAKLTQTGLTVFDGWGLDNTFVNWTNFDVDGSWHALANVDWANTNTAGQNPSDANLVTAYTNLFTTVAPLLPGNAILTTNTAGKSGATAYTQLNGTIMEGLESTGGAEFTLANMKTLIQAAFAPPVAGIFGASGAGASLSAVQTNYSAMRFAAAFVTVYSDHWFDYDEWGFNVGHQTLWWYDEYDNVGAGLGYLGTATSSAIADVSGIDYRTFTKGAVLCNNTAGSLTITIAGYKHLTGVQDSTTNDGTKAASFTVAAHDGLFLIAAGSHNLNIGFQSGIRIMDSTGNPIGAAV